MRQKSSSRGFFKAHGAVSVIGANTIQQTSQAPEMDYKDVRFELPNDALLLF